MYIVKQLKGYVKNMRLMLFCTSFIVCTIPTVLASTLRGASRISGKGVHMYKGVGLALLIFITLLLNIP